ncbi:uncharacterized protein LTR77_008748 [Saxophila tyrrhenica]|uniref:Amino acid transporter n=1 Tax=Saxophila tyrrhenica TaxID=1690608 RepID=A0AAV9P234_9PEZI|nr:hypothetical protein LTR77_008748 [Saxophila tyrrhenica]
MPLNANEEALLGHPSTEELDYEHQRLDYSPEERNKIGKWTIVALILNRSIGSGIFLTPHRVLQGAGCVGGALFLWTAGALISICGLYVWLECGLSIPQRRVRGETEPRGVPRSGGEKNFLEFMFPDSDLRLPHIRTTCCFAVMFVLMYNLSTNAIAFGLQVMTASGHYDGLSPDGIPSRGPVLGIAIAVLTLIVLLHTFSRRGGILINNAFAVLKVGALVVMVCLAIAYAAGRFGGPGDVVRNNFIEDVWKSNRAGVSSWSRSLTLCMYSFSGYEQPFYVLAEVKSPRRYFPKYTVLGLLITVVLYMMANISYLLVVDKADIIPPLGGKPSSADIATLFFNKLFGDDQKKASHAMAAIIAVSIFGNLWVMTFTAARVKQEIAKEGILPFSLHIATSYKTPYGLFKLWLSRGRLREEDVEQAPTAAFALHWFTSVLLVVLVSPIRDPRRSYSALVALYSYTVISLIGCWVSIGLLRIKLRKSRWHWQERRRYRPWLSPLHVIVFGAATAFVLVTAFVPPEPGSPFHRLATGQAWYIVPVVGITAPLWGMLWYWGLLAYQWKIGRHLVVTREAYWMPDPDCPGEFVQQAEIIDHTWQITLRSEMADDFERLPGMAEMVDERHDGWTNGNTAQGRNAPRMRRRLSDSFE